MLIFWAFLFVSEFFDFTTPEPVEFVLVLVYLSVPTVGPPDKVWVVIDPVMLAWKAIWVALRCLLTSMRPEPTASCLWEEMCCLWSDCCFYWRMFFCDDIYPFFKKSFLNCLVWLITCVLPVWCFSSSDPFLDKERFDWNLGTFLFSVTGGYFLFDDNWSLDFFFCKDDLFGMLEWIIEISSWILFNCFWMSEDTCVCPYEPRLLPWEPLPWVYLTVDGFNIACMFVSGFLSLSWVESTLFLLIGYSYYLSLSCFIFVC